MMKHSRRISSVPAARGLDATLKSLVTLLCRYTGESVTDESINSSRVTVNLEASAKEWHRVWWPNAAINAGHPACAFTNGSCCTVGKLRLLLLPLALLGEAELQQLLVHAAEVAS